MTDPIPTPQIDDQFVIAPVPAGSPADSPADSNVAVGQIGAVKAGVLTPAAAGDAALIALGRVDRIRDGRAWIRRGTFGWRNSAGAKRVGADRLGMRCYLAGPDSVQATASGNAPAGLVVGFEDGFVWVDMRNLGGS